MSRLSISEGMAGLLVLLLGLGSLCVMPLLGGMVARRGSARAIRLAGWGLAPALIFVTLAPDLVSIGLAILFFGGMVGGMDVAMNANAVAAERAKGRAILSSCHGFWSLGAFLGAGLGGMAIHALGELAHAVLVSAIFTLVLAGVQGHLLQDGPAPGSTRVPLHLPRQPLPYLIGVMALLAMVPEGAVLDWAAVYLTRELGASLAVAGWGFATCAGAMAVMRFLGDALRRRLGAVRCLRLSAVLAMLGLSLAALASSPSGAIAGFALAGLGIANMVPIAFSAAGNIDGLPPGIGLSIVTMLGYSGILVAPGVIGGLAEWVSFSTIFL
ncbi:MAG: MFS transporter, partial [Paracoccus sp. (in: a-proteobacteria)]|nr:MFS transporter [Paracoccus sp. (in: a-proteobacteria)]